MTEKRPLVLKNIVNHQFFLEYLLPFLDETK
jgi:hypothetical protein